MPCICSPISYRELWMRLRRQTTPIWWSGPPCAVQDITSRTEPVVEFLDPVLPCMFYWWVEEDDLVLYPDLMHNGLECHTALKELRSGDNGGGGGGV
jgi:hypothetical protein